MMPATAWAGKGTNVHFAAFFSSGGPGSVNFPDAVKGDDIQASLMKKGAEMMLFAQSSSVKDGDVLNVQNDTLRSTAAGFKDIGLDCHIMVKSDPGIRIIGQCGVHMAKKKKHTIPFTPIGDRLVWHKVFEDKKQGVAGYFMAKEN
jgi:hypothetical protein